MRITTIQNSLTMSSCEPRRTSAYSEDLRWRMVWQRFVRGLTLKEIASNLCVDASTVMRITKKFDAIGQVSKSSRPSRNSSRAVKLSRPIQFTILCLLLDNPSLYLREIQRELSYTFNLDVSSAAICRFLKRSHFSRKKMQLIALQRDQCLRDAYVRDVSLYRNNFMVFVDETGCDRRDIHRKYGYGLCGKRVKSQQLLVRGERISVIAAMTINGVACLQVVHGTVTGNIFVEFTQKKLLPCLMNFDGINDNSVVVMDNCSIHHVQGVASSIKDIGALVHYLPPYSPDFNPIEMLFSKVKSSLKGLEQEYSTIQDTETLVLLAFSTVTPRDCTAWVDSCNIYTT